MPASPADVALNGQIVRSDRRALIAMARSSSAAMNLVNCVTLLQRLAKLTDGAAAEEHVLEPVTERLSVHFDAREGFGPRHVSGTLWACAKMQVAPAPLLRAAISAGCNLNPQWYKPHELSLAVWALGKLHGAGGLSAQNLGPAAEALVARLLPSAFERSAHLDTQGLANLAGGMASLAQPAQPHAADAASEGAVSRGAGAVRSGTRDLVRAIGPRLLELKPQELANVLYSLAKLDARVTECDARFAPAAARALAVAARADGTTGGFTPRQLANAGWAVSRLLDGLQGRQPRVGGGAERAERLSFWRLLAPALARRCSDLNAQELSMSAWAAANALRSCEADEAGGGGGD